MVHSAFAAVRPLLRKNIAVSDHADFPKLQKHLAGLGLGSRREIEKWIASGRIRVNTRTAELGDRVGPSDVIRIDGRRVRAHKQSGTPVSLVLRYHKPLGEVCSRSDARGRPSVFSRLPAPKSGRWIGIGRLDINTAGLLLFSNNGEIAHRLMHPSYGIEREYAVRVRGEVTAAMLKRLRSGLDLDDGWARFDRISPGAGAGSNRWYHVVISEGRTREVRRLWGSQGLQVSRLIRVRFGPIRLTRGLRQGRCDELAPAEVRALEAAVGLG